jgi:DNA invertase Pin-like site-specific DNA recombinase
MSGTVGIYVRVSRKGDREDERFHSPGEQAERAIALAVAKGYTPGPVFEDINVSGATAPADRPAMGKLLGRIDSGELAGVAAYALDRLSRDPGHGDALVKRITRAGGVVLTPDIPEAIDSPTGEFTFGMLLQVAKLYRSTAGARFASAKERAIRAGIPVGTAPVGYRQRADRTLELDPATAPVVRELYERPPPGARPPGSPPWPASGRGHRPAVVTPGVAGASSAIASTPPAASSTGDVVSDVGPGPSSTRPSGTPPRAPSARRPARRAPRRRGSSRASCGAPRAGAPALGRGRPSTARPAPGHMDWVTVENPQRRYRCRDLNCQAKANVDADRLERWVVLESFRAGDELLSRSTAPDLTALEEALAQAERRLAQALEPEAQDALGDAWASTVKARRRERDAVAHELGDARREAGAPVVDFRLRDVWDSYSPEDRRAALGLYWKVIHVGRPNGTGTPLKLVARGPGREAELELPNDERAP